jgi:hypothetical protein
MKRLTKFQLLYKGYCTACIKAKSKKRDFNFYTGEYSASMLCMDPPAGAYKYRVKDVQFDVLVSFDD